MQFFIFGKYTFWLKKLRLKKMFYRNVRLYLKFIIMIIFSAVFYIHALNLFKSLVNFLYNF